MIAPQELKQNNLIRDIESGRIGAVLTIGEKKCTIKMPYSKLSQSYEEFEPIELTEDWLLKMGFDKKAEHNFRLKVFARSRIHAYTHGKVEIELGNMSGYSFGYPQVYFVHHLQSLYFALTGEELKIKES